MPRRNRFAASLPALCFVCLVSAQSPTPTRESKVDQFISFGGKFFKSIKSKPATHKVKKEKNKYGESRPDEWHTDVYPGFKVEFLRAKSAPYDLLSTLSITDPSIELP